MKTIWHYRVLIPALTLIVAALFKTWSAIYFPDEAAYVFDSIVFTILLVVFEIFLATILACGYRQFKYIAFCTFLSFTLYSVLTIIVGNDHCNCFGAFKIDARLMLVGNVANSLILWSTIGNNCQGVVLSFFPNRHLVIAMLGLAAVSVSLIHYFKDKKLSENSIKILLPEQWVGGRLPFEHQLVGEGKLKEASP